MLLDLTGLQGVHARFERALAAAAFDSRGEEYVVAADVWLGFDIHKARDKYRLVGRVRTTLELTCGRCLDSFPYPVDLPFDLLYLPHSENAGEGEIEVQEHDLAAGFYRDEQIDLGQLVREQFYLSLPMKPLCRETCRGLCPECGTNLNQNTCTCEHRWVDPRMEGLKRMLQDQ